MNIRTSRAPRNVSVAGPEAVTRIGSLFSGAGGLDMAVEAAFGGTVVWHCEIDPAASKVLATRWPDVPNLIDVTEVNWSNWKPLLEVDILCGGYPCQPFSAAGQRKGTNDERHLWPYFAEAIRHLRPRFVVLENVAGHRSMGFDRVLADLAGIGYDAQWCSVRASDVGAPHRRERLFVIANASGDRCGWHAQFDSGAQRPELEASQRHDAHRCGNADANPASDGRDEGRPEPARLKRGSDAAVSSDGPVNLLPTPNAQDGNGGGRFNSDGHQSTLPGTVRELLPTPRSTDCFGPGLHGDGGMDLRTTVTLLPTPTQSDGTGGGIRTGLSWEGTTKSTGDGGNSRLRDVAGLLTDDVQWGKYEPAIRRWESLTRPAPAPTEPNTKGNPRLAAALSEWMMGWPQGWVTAVPGISRNEALRIIGNGVVPQQAIAALRWLLSVSEVAA
jgi:DNA (cytosine-5)-methyltransferase 1